MRAVVVVVRTKRPKRKATRKKPNAVRASRRKPLVAAPRRPMKPKKPRNSCLNSIFCEKAPPSGRAFLVLGIEISNQDNSDESIGVAPDCRFR